MRVKSPGFARLKACGRVDVWTLQGGIQAWARTVDTSLTLY